MSAGSRRSVDPPILTQPTNLSAWLDQAGALSSSISGLVSVWVKRDRGVSGRQWLAAWEAVGVVVPSGTVTFLFTDIEGSTGCGRWRPTAMPVALERHDAIVRSAVESHGGYVFSTGGDGFGAAFARAGEAVAAAVEAQAALGAECWPEGAEIRVRMGVHTGEVTERGGDYFGTAVNQAARLMAVGHGGQVLCSQATAELLPSRVVLVGSGRAPAAGPVGGAAGVPGGRGALPAVAVVGCGAGEPADGVDGVGGPQRRRRRSRRAGGRAAAGDVDGGGRDRQDPLGVGGGRRGGAVVRGRVLVGGVGAGRHRRRGAGGGGGGDGRPGHGSGWPGRLCGGSPGAGGVGQLRARAGRARPAVAWALLGGGAGGGDRGHLPGAARGGRRGGARALASLVTPDDEDVDVADAAGASAVRLFVARAGAASERFVLDEHERGGGGGDLPAAGWDPVGHRVGRGAGAGHGPGGDRPPSGGTVPAAGRGPGRRGAAPDPAGDGGLVA